MGSDGGRGAPGDGKQEGGGARPGPAEVGGRAAGGRGLNAAAGDPRGAPDVRPEPGVADPLSPDRPGPGEPENGRCRPRGEPPSPRGPLLALRTQGARHARGGPRPGPVPIGEAPAEGGEGGGEVRRRRRRRAGERRGRAREGHGSGVRAGPRRGPVERRRGSRASPLPRGTSDFQPRATERGIGSPRMGTRLSGVRAEGNGGAGSRMEGLSAGDPRPKLGHYGAPTAGLFSRPPAPPAARTPLAGPRPRPRPGSRR